MSGLRTHYDNLKVAENAPPEVIEAAYRSLIFKYHPDRNPGNRKCEEITRILNQAYAVLSDSAKRREHDAWIAQNKASATSRPAPSRSVVRSSWSWTPRKTLAFEGQI